MAISSEAKAMMKAITAVVIEVRNVNSRALIPRDHMPRARCRGPATVLGGPSHASRGGASRHVGRRQESPKCVGHAITRCNEVSYGSKAEEYALGDCVRLSPDSGHSLVRFSGQLWAKTGHP